MTVCQKVYISTCISVSRQVSTEVVKQVFGQPSEIQNERKKPAKRISKNGQREQKE